MDNKQLAAAQKSGRQAGPPAAARVRAGSLRRRRAGEGRGGGGSRAQRRGHAQRRQGELEDERRRRRRLGKHVSQTTHRSLYLRQFKFLEALARKVHRLLQCLDDLEVKLCSRASWAPRWRWTAALRAVEVLPVISFFFSRLIHTSFAFSLRLFIHTCKRLHMMCVSVPCGCWTSGRGCIRAPQRNERVENPAAIHHANEQREVLCIRVCATL